MSKPLKLNGSLGSNDVPFSDGQRLDIFPIFRRMADTITGTLTGTLSSALLDLPPAPLVSKLPKHALLLKKESTSSMQGSLQGNRLGTLKGKLKVSKPNIPPASSSEIVRLGLTSNAKASCRFYNSSLRGVYESCILPTETAFVALHTILSSTYSTSTTRRSVWRHTTLTPPSMNLQRTLSLSLPFWGRECTAGEVDPNGNPKKRAKTAKSTKQPTISSETTTDPGNEDTKKRKLAPFKRSVKMEGKLRYLKFRMLPTKKQDIELKNCVSVTIMAYNYANKRVRDDKACANRISLRTEWEKMDHPPEVRAVCRRFARGAINDLVDAYTSNYAKLKTNPNHKFEVKDRDELNWRSESLQVERTKVLLEVIPVKVPDWVRKRKNHEEFVLASGIVSATPIRPERAWMKRRAECLLRFGNNLGDQGPIRIQGKKKTIDMVVKSGKDLHAAARIQWNKSANAFYFIWAYELPVLQDPDPTFENKSVVSLDPGVNPFQEWYSPTSGRYGVLLSDEGPNLKQRGLDNDKIRKRIDRRLKNPQKYTTLKLQKDSSNGKCKRKRQRLTRSLRKKYRRECLRLSRYVESAHYDSANFLLRQHDIVIAPILHTDRLVDKSTRCYGSKMARIMYAWSHRLFRQRLAFAAARYPGRHVFECIEPGTSKTCTNCGWWNYKLKLGDKVCKCPRCGIIVDRQLAGARNNFFAAYGMAAGIGWDGVGM